MQSNKVFILKKIKEVNKNAMIPVNSTDKTLKSLLNEVPSLVYQFSMNSLLD